MMKNKSMWNILFNMILILSLKLAYLSLNEQPVNSCSIMANKLTILNVNHEGKRQNYIDHLNYYWSRSNIFTFSYPNTKIDNTHRNSPTLDGLLHPLKL